MHKLTFRFACVVTMSCVTASPAIADELLEKALAAHSMWYGCLLENTMMYASSTDEPADTVVKAAFGKCIKHESQVKSASFSIYFEAGMNRYPTQSEWFIQSQLANDKAFDERRRQNQEDLIATVLDERAKIKRKNLLIEGSK